jgi:hypothetical protein
MRLANLKHSLGVRAFSVGEMMIAMGVLSVVMTAVYTSSSALLGSMTASRNYSVGQLQTVDYLTLDLRRAQDYAFTTVGTTLTLPLTLTLPSYYAADGKTPNAPQRTLVTTSNKKNKKDHKVFEARYYYHYGTLGSGVTVLYTLSNGTLYRKEGTMAARAVGTGIESVTFGPSAAAIDLDPMVTTTVTFTATKRSKQVPPPLSSMTFMRQYYYSDI